jgi:putative phosphoesterase
MRVAALYDIHGNPPALEAVLRDVREAEVDIVVVGGDVLPGPMPSETLTRLFDLDVPAKFIKGNSEVAVLQEMAGKEPTGVPAQHRHVITWTAQQLDDARKSLIAACPKTLRIDISGIGRVFFCHATPQNENDIFTRITPEERLSRVFEGVDAGVVVCGHTHMQFDRTVGGVRVVNAGSIGMPFGEAAAYWLLLASGVPLRRTSYDLVGAADRIGTTRYPEAREFAARNVLGPPSEDEMLAVFTRAEIR